MSPFSANIKCYQGPLPKTTTTPIPTVQPTTAEPVMEAQLLEALLESGEMSFSGVQLKQAEIPTTVAATIPDTTVSGFDANATTTTGANPSTIVTTTTTYGTYTTTNDYILDDTNLTSNVPLGTNG